MDLVQLDNPGSSIPLYISPQIEDMLGYPREAWLTDDELWLQVLHPDDAERMMRADEDARRTLSSLFAEYRMVARDGRVVWVSEKATVVQDEAGGAVYWQGTDNPSRREYPLAWRPPLWSFSSCSSCCPSPSLRACSSGRP